MATETQILFLKGERDIHRQFEIELLRLEGTACRAYGGRKKVNADLNYHKGQRAAYTRLLKLAKLNKF